MTANGNQEDRERGAAAKLQKKLGDATRRADRKDDELRRAFETTQVQLGDACHQAGVLQRGLMLFRARNVRLLKR